MKNVLIFIGGIVAGIVAMFLVIFAISIGIKRNTPIDESYYEKAVQVQYVEIRGKKGEVILHTGMPKDSVKILVGKPDEINLRTIGNVTFEQWGYKIRNQYVSDLDIDFEDGKLKSVRQN